MIFSSSLFLLYFFPAFFILYFLSPTRYKNIVILAGSLTFYVWGAPKFIAVLVLSMMVDFFFAKALYPAVGKKKKILISLSIALNVVLLAYFKYFNFFIDNINVLAGCLDVSPIRAASVALPIGISFFTFHKISYLADIYRGVKPPMQKISDYFVYILLFPQLIAGPIIRFHEIADQIQNRDESETSANRLKGLFRFVIGLSKKVLIANALGAEADRIFSLPAEELSFAVSWAGALAYTFQIYFDFSGYSDMAIGMGKMMGFTFPENFNFPYIAQSITGFWQRWHMSLSRWMRDYLYIPLGGNKVKPVRVYLNLWTVFIISGFWHGAQWTFVAWGVYHGLFLVVERMASQQNISISWKYPKIILSFVVVMFGWVLFRSETINQAYTFSRAMLDPDFSDLWTGLSNKSIVLLFVASITSFMGLSEQAVRFSDRLFRENDYLVVRVLFVLLLVISCLAEIMSSGFNPFIYFRF